MRLSEHQTNDLIFKLEERKYGHRLNSVELSHKADVSLDYVNRVERQIPIGDQRVMEKIANALGITSSLLRKIAGFEDISADTFHQLEKCLAEPQPEGQGEGGKAVSPECERIGLRPLP